MQILNFGRVDGLTPEELAQLQELTNIYNTHQGNNVIKDKYYEGHITLQDVSLGIALPSRCRLPGLTQWLHRQCKSSQGMDSRHQQQIHPVQCR